MKLVGDLNFFAPYITQAQVTRKRLVYISFSVFLIFLLLGGVFVANYIRGYAIEREIAAKESYLASPEMVEKAKEMHQLKDKIGAAQSYKKLVEEIEGQLEDVNIIHVDLMNTLASTLPAGLVFQNLNLSVRDFTVTGVANTREAIAELEFNLKREGLFTQVHVNNISREQSGLRQYTFSITATFK